MAIYKKLLQIQQQGITLDKDGRNPHFSSEYATLNEVLRKIKKPLNDLGIVVVQAAGGEYQEASPNFIPGLRTELVDTEDNSSISCFMPYIDAGTSQKLGSANTYLRRYSLITLLGLEDEDDDGNTASTPQTAKMGVVGGTMKRSAGVVEAKGEPFVSASGNNGSTDGNTEGGGTSDLSDIKWD